MGKTHGFFLYMMYGLSNKIMFCAEMTIFIRGKKKNRNGRMFMVIYKITSIKLYFVG